MCSAMARSHARASLGFSGLQAAAAGAAAFGGFTTASLRLTFRLAVRLTLRLIVTAYALPLNGTTFWVGSAVQYRSHAVIKSRRLSSASLRR